MGIVASMILIAFGAILTWAVNAHVNGVNVTAVGVILMVVGLVSFALSLIFWSSWFGPGYWGGRQRVVRTGGAVPRRRISYGAGGQTVVQDDVVQTAPPPVEPMP